MDAPFDIPLLITRIVDIAISVLEDNGFLVSIIIARRNDESKGVYFYATEELN